MYTVSALEKRDDTPVEDHVVQLSGVSWDDYERFLEIRGDRSAPRFTYLEGELEIMSPSRDHEQIKSIVGRLFEAYCLERGIRFLPLGSWTLKERKELRGAEPDECYVLGTEPEKAERPHVAIEVVWTSGRMNKLEVYRRLGVREVWYWKKGHLKVHALRGDQYEKLARSELVPDLGSPRFWTGRRPTTRSKTTGPRSRSGERRAIPGDLEKRSEARPRAALSRTVSGIVLGRRRFVCDACVARLRVRRDAELLAQVAVRGWLEADAEDERASVREDADVAQTLSEIGRRSRCHVDREQIAAAAVVLQREHA